MKSHGDDKDYVEVPGEQRSALVHEEMSGAHVQGVGGLGESYGARDPEGGGDLSGYGYGGGRGVGNHGAEPACVGGGENADDDGRSALAVTTSYPSCDPSYSCCHWRLVLDGEPEQLSVSL